MNWLVRRSTCWTWNEALLRGDEREDQTVQKAARASHVAAMKIRQARKIIKRIHAAAELYGFRSAVIWHDTLVGDFVRRHYGYSLGQLNKAARVCEGRR